MYGFLFVMLEFAMLASTGLLVMPFPANIVPKYTRKSSETLENSNAIEAILSHKSLTSYQQKSLPLKDCIVIALKRNPDLLANFNLIQQNEWNLISARRQWFPTLNLGSSTIYGGQKSFQSIRYASKKQAIYNSYQQSLPSLSLSWYFLNPIVQPNINSNLAQLKAQRFTYDYIARGLILQVQTAYINVQSSQLLIKAYRDIYYNNKKQVDYLTAQLAKGMIDLGALEQSKTTLYQQLASLVQFQQQFLSQSSTLAQLLGYTDNTIIVASDPLISKEKWVLSLEESIENARRSREEIKAYLQTADSYRWNARQLLNTYYPSFYINYTAGGTYQSGCLNVKNPSGCPNIPSTNDQSNNSLNLGLTWLFDGGLNAATANSNKSAASANENYAINAETEAVQQVKTSYALYKNNSEALELASKQLLSAQITSHVTSERFRVGIGDVTTLVQAQQLLSSATQTRVQTLQQYNLAIAQLYRYSALLPIVSYNNMIDILN
jgi:hypothetical protein